MNMKRNSNLQEHDNKFGFKWTWKEIRIYTVAPNITMPKAQDQPPAKHEDNNLKNKGKIWIFRGGVVNYKS